MFDVHNEVRIRTHHCPWRKILNIVFSVSILDVVSFFSVYDLVECWMLVDHFLLQNQKLVVDMQDESRLVFYTNSYKK